MKKKKNNVGLIIAIFIGIIVPIVTIVFTYTYKTNAMCEKMVNGDPVLIKCYNEITLNEVLKSKEIIGFFSVLSFILFFFIVFLGDAADGQKNKLLSYLTIVVISGFYSIYLFLFARMFSFAILMAILYAIVFLTVIADLVMHEKKTPKK